MIDEKNPHNLYYLKHDYKKLKAYTFYYVNFEDENNYYISLGEENYAVKKYEVMLYSAPMFEISKEDAISYLKFDLINFKNNCSKLISTVYCNEKIDFTLDDLIDALLNLINENIDPIYYKNYLENYFSLVHNCQIGEYFVDDPFLEDESHIVTQYVENIIEAIRPALLKDEIAIKFIESVIKEVEISNRNLSLPFEQREFTFSQKQFLIKSLSFKLTHNKCDNFKILRKFNLILDELEEMNDYDALIIRGFDYYLGNKITEVDYEEALKRFLKVSEIDDDDGYFNNIIGLIYYYPRIDNKRDFKKAYQYFTKSAFYDNDEAKLNLVDMYLNGEYVSKDAKVARKMVNSIYDKHINLYFNNEFNLYPEICSKFALCQYELKSLNDSALLFHALFSLAYFKRDCEANGKNIDYNSFSKKMYELVHDKIDFKFEQFKSKYEIKTLSDFTDIFYFINESKSFYQASFKEDGDFLRIEISGNDKEKNIDLVCVFHRFGISRMTNNIVLYFRKPHHPGFRKKSKIIFENVEYRIINENQLSLNFFYSSNLIYSLKTNLGYLSTEEINNEPIYINKVLILEDDYKESYYCSNEPFLESETVDVLKEDGTKVLGSIIYSKKTIKEDLPFPYSMMEFIYH